MDALGDIKMLQKLEEKKLKALGKMIDPPMVASTDLKGKGATVIEGGVTYVDVTQGQNGFTPAYQIRPDIQNIGLEIMNVEQRIRRFFFNDLFLSILTTGKEMTATEVAERHEEKMIMLGPVIERMQAELHDPILERTFSIMSDIGMLPPAPPELQGVDLKIEYISLLAQAQKLVGTGAIERVAGFVSTVGQAIPQTLDKFNADEAVDQYAEMVGVPPTTATNGSGGAFSANVKNFSRYKNG